MKPSESWPALVLTAGLGTRLRPLSYDRAKPAMPVAGEPLIRRILRWLARDASRDVVLNLHYKPDTIAAVVGEGADLSTRVRYSWEPVILGSAGGPRHALPILDADRFFLINGDTLTNVDLHLLARAHLDARARVTMAVVPSADPYRYGGVLLDGGTAVRGFTRPGTDAAAWHFVGVQMANADVFKDLPLGQRVDTVADVYPALIARDPGSVRGFVCEASFQDIGTPADYLATSLALARAEGLAAPPIGARARLHPTARIDRTVIWDDVMVEASCHLCECVLGDGVRIPAGSRFEGCAIVRAGGRDPAGGEERIGDLLVARTTRFAAPPRARTPA